MRGKRLAGCQTLIDIDYRYFAYSLPGEPGYLKRSDDGFKNHMQLVAY